MAVREGSRVAQGATCWPSCEPPRWRGEREATAADAASADRLASLAASRGDAAEERLHRIRGEALRRELALLDEELGLHQRARARCGHGADAPARGEDGQLTRRGRPPPGARPNRHARAGVRRGAAGHPAGPARAGGPTPGGCPASRTFAGRVTSIAQLPVEQDGGGAIPGPGRRSQSRRPAQARAWRPTPGCSRIPPPRRPGCCAARCAGSGSSGGGSGRETPCARSGRCWSPVGTRLPNPEGARCREPARSRALPTRHAWSPRRRVTVSVPLSLPAQLYVEHDAAIYARSPGIVESILADLGTRVAAGQLLARLESTDQDDRPGPGARERHANAVVQVERQRALKTRRRGHPGRLGAGRAGAPRGRAGAPEGAARLRSHPDRRRRSAAWSRRGPRAIGRLVEPGDSLFQVTALAPVLAGVRRARGLRLRGASWAPRPRCSGPRGEQAPRPGGASEPGASTRRAAPARWCSSSPPATGCRPGAASRCRSAREPRRVVAVPARGGRARATRWCGTRTGRRFAPGHRRRRPAGDRVEVVSGLAAGREGGAGGP